MTQADGTSERTTTTYIRFAAAPLAKRSKFLENASEVRISQQTEKMKTPTLPAWYRKPVYRDVKEYGTQLRYSRKRSLSLERNNQASIPSKLSLERILNNKTCKLTSSHRPEMQHLLMTHYADSPMSLYDFYMYLKYCEHSAENLEFFIWFVSYSSTIDFLLRC